MDWRQQQRAPVAYGPGITALEEEYINKNGFRRYWDETACAPYLYNGDTFITYDDEESIKKKCELILRGGYRRNNGLGAWR